jgi:hypothetical protein
MWFAVVLLCGAMMLDRIYFLRREKEKKLLFYIYTYQKLFFQLFGIKA